MGNRPTRREAVMDWLLEDEQPAIRYLVLTQLVGSPQTDPEVQSARKAIPVRGWAADLLARQECGGWRVCGGNLYRFTHPIAVVWFWRKLYFCGS